MRRALRLAGIIVLGTIGIVIALWCVGALWFAPLPPWLAATLVAGYLMALAVAWRRPRVRPFIAGATLAVIVAHLALVRPSHQRDWSPDQARLPQVTLVGAQATIAGSRHCRYRAVDDYDVAYERATWDLDAVASAWFIVEPFATRPAAHTFLSFGFDDGRYLAVSVEIRKQRGETFSPLAGMFRRYELMYVLGDERDLIGVRVLHRHDEVFLYPLRVTRAQARALLGDVLARVAAIEMAPEHYHTFLNSCSVNIARHVDRLWPGRVPWRAEVFLPADADRLVLELGLIDSDLPLAECRARHRVDPLAAADLGAGFSTAIRRR